MVRDRRAFATFDLSAECAERQKRALRAKLMIVPWKPLHPDDDLFYLCQACGQFNAPVIAATANTDASAARIRNNMYGTGVYKAIYDTTTGLLMCQHQRPPVSVRKDCEKGDYDDFARPLEDEREARKVRHYLSTTRCASVPVTPVHMLGRLVRLNGMLWALCEVCATPTQWAGDKWSRLGFTCGLHHDDGVKAGKEPTATARRMRATEEVYGVDATCTYCAVPLARSAFVTEICVVDDLDQPDDDIHATYGYDLYTLCAFCSKGVRHATDAAVVRKTALHNSIAHAHKMRYMHSERMPSNYRRPG
jgi:hypothetical protein